MRRWAERRRTIRPFSKPIRAGEERNGPPSVKQGLPTAKPRHSHAISAQC